MPAWTFSSTVTVAGRHQIVITKRGHAPVDVTMFRNAPTKIESYSNGDPFGDAAAVLSFPQLTGFDDLDSQDVGTWLGDYASVDIYWVPAVAGGASDWISPLTNKLGSSEVGASRTKVFEGFIASLDIAGDGNTSSLSAQCQGALYQLDRYLAKPYFPPRPVPLEKLIAESFDRKAKPELRTAKLVTRYPTGWSKVVPAYTKKSATLYTPDAKPGSKYTGYSSRQTGSWDHTLTGFVADLLAVMYVDDESGVVPGNQWTVLQEPGRVPVLTVRDRFRAPDFTLWFGTPGVVIRATHDTTQATNRAYGEGTSLDGTGWRNAVISSDGTRTDYEPLAEAPSKERFVSESYVSYGAGFPQDQAINSAEKSLQRDREPGWAGEMTLQIDPTISRYTIRSGMTVKVKGFAGTADNGMNFHIAEVSVDVEAGVVTCKIDTRYRDLLNLEEAQARTRDPLTPSKMLQINRRSVLIEDIMAPWDYTAGSGFIPKKSTKFHKHRPASTLFPWASWIKENPPREHPGYYVKVNAHKAKRRDRWTIGRDVPILMAQKGTIRRIEMVAVDRDGNIAKIPFHFSLYYTVPTALEMPRDASGPSAFITGAFESTAPNGQPWPAGSHLAPDPNMLIGWGNSEQPAGYSPGRKSEGYPATGVLIDEATFTFDMMANPNFDKNAKPGSTQKASAIQLYGAFYAEWTKPVYFIGRMYRAEPGT